MSLNFIKIPGSVTSIGYNTFEGCSNLETIVFEDSEETLYMKSGNYMYVSFQDCPLKDLYLGRNLNYPTDKNYGYSPFYKNIDLEIISIGSYVNNCKSLYFDKYEKLQTINCYPSVPPTASEFSTFQYTNLIVNIPISSLSNYQKNKIWGKFWNLQETLPSPFIQADELILNIESTELNIGDSVQLQATVLPEDTTDKTVVWNSSNESVATVSDNGLVTAISSGTAVITATCGEVSAECKITVNNPIVDAQQIVLNMVSAEIFIGETVQLESTVLPEDATDKTVVWNSSNEGVATVSEIGLVTAISTGTTIINATCGDVTATCEITVIEDSGVESLLANPDNEISIYSIEGILIKENCMVQDLKTLNKGIYIIVSGRDRYKISI